MKLNESFLIHTAGDETVLVPVGGSAFSGIVRGNKTLGAVLGLLRNETTEAAIVAAMRARFDASEGAVERDVAKVLSELRAIGALDE